MTDFPPPPSSDVPPPPPSMSSPPPGYVAYGTSEAAFRSFSPIKGIAMALVILLGVSMVSTIINTVLQLSLADPARDFLAERISTDDFEDELAPWLGGTLLGVVASVAVLVLQILWLWRMSSNLPLLGRQGQTWRPPWAIGVMLLGTCTLFILPLLMMRELWKGSDPESPPGDPQWKSRPVTPLLTAWFVLTLAGAGVGIASGISNFNIGNDTDDLARSFDDNGALIAAAGVLTLLATAVFIVFVRQLSARHRALTGEP